MNSIPTYKRFAGMSKTRNHMINEIRRCLDERFHLRGVKGHIYFLLALQDGDVCIKPLQKEVSKTSCDILLAHLVLIINKVSVKTVLPHLDHAHDT